MAADYRIWTVDPKNPTGPKVQAILHRSLYLRLYKYRPVDYENLRGVIAVLENPERIFEGLRLENEGYWCFVGKPEKWFVKEDSEESFPGDKVFAVYLNNRMYVFDFAAEEVDGEDALSPKNWKDRFTRLAWKNTR